MLEFSPHLHFKMHQTFILILRRALKAFLKGENELVIKRPFNFFTNEKFLVVSIKSDTCTKIFYVSNEVS